MYAVSQLFARITRLAAPMIAAALLSPTGAHAATAGDTLLTSGVPLPAGAIGVANSGSNGTGSATRSAISSNGRYVAFLSMTDDLAPGAHPDAVNVYRKDRLTGAVALISQTSGPAGVGLPAIINPEQVPLAISNDGNRVAFASTAAFVPADTDDKLDVYVRDVASATTILATPGTAFDIEGADLSGDGNWVAFVTEDALAGANDTNALGDVYRRNLASGAQVLASAVDGGVAAGNGGTGSPSISDNGRWVAFSSTATNLIAAYVANGGVRNVFARDLDTLNTELISAKFNSAVTGGNGSSRRPIIAGTPTLANTLKVAYASDATDVADNSVTDTSSADSAYLRTFGTTASKLVSRANGAGGANANSRAHLGGISDDGQRIVFASDASNLPGATASSYYAAYTRNLAGDTTTLLSASNDYAVEPALSGDGSFATWFEIGATADIDPTLHAVAGRPFAGGPVEIVSRPPGSAPLIAAAPWVNYSSGQRTISADGRYVIFTAAGGGLGGTNAMLTYRRDQQTGALELASRATGETGAAPTRSIDSAAIDASGTRVLFVTSAALDPADTNTTVDAYLRDFTTNTTTLVSRATGAGGAVSNGSVNETSLSADGNRVAFRTAATNLGVAGGNQHIYVRDVAAATTDVADRAPGAAGAIANQASSSPRLSGDGRLVVFVTPSTNLSGDDAAGASTDVYLRDLSANTTTLLSRRPGLTGAKNTGSNFSPAISSDGTTAAFVTSDSATAPEAGPWTDRQVVARKIATGENILVSRAAGGAPAATDADDPSVSADGNVVAFSTAAPNLLPGLGGAERDAIFVRTLATNSLSGPPAFGLAIDGVQQRATTPSISEDGRCVAFHATGHNAITGPAGDFPSAYVYVVSGTCGTPQAAAAASPPTPTATPASTLSPRPVLTGVSVSNNRFKVGARATALAAATRPKRAKTGTAFRFSLNTTATVRIAIIRRLDGRRVGTRCLAPTPKRATRKRCTREVTVGTLTRANVAPGRRSVAFSGRMGKRKLVSGRYRARLIATSASGASTPVAVSFSVVRR